PCCQGVIALTDDESVNVKVAITSKLLRPQVPVICRAESQSTVANLASFDTDHIINPYRVFADHLAMALRTPSVHLLYKWLISIPGLPLPEPIRPPRGTWIVCGFGRFGRAVNRYLQFEGVPTVIIEPDPAQAPKGAIVGRGTEAVTLREAGVEKAIGIVAGADSDINNLSIIMTAKALNPELYVVARQNRRSNDPVFATAPIDLVMQASRIIVWRVLPLLTSPLLGDFLRHARHHNEQWAQELIDRLRGICGGRTPLIWPVMLDSEEAPAVQLLLQEGACVTLDRLLREPRGREEKLNCLTLMLWREGKEELLPSEDLSLRAGDRLLLCGRPEMREQLEWALYNRNVLEYLLTGEEYPDGYIWRWLAHRHQQRAAR
ncbi:MAG: NAD-binding protein, partial [Candidatus Competibacterales bacterium]|nr:NAD-binding protein [Candidatus Competibacterales bacterium]